MKKQSPKKKQQSSKKSRQKNFFTSQKLMITLAIMGLLVGGVWLTCHLVSKPKTADATLSHLTKDAKSTYANADFQPADAWMAEATATAFNNVKGFDYRVATAGKGIFWAVNFDYTTKSIHRHLFFKKTLQSTISVNEIKTFVGDRLKSYGFTTSDHKTYQKNDVTCTVLNDPPQLEHPGANEASNLLYVNCFDASTIRAAATDMKPFVESYLKANPSVKPSELSVGPLSVKSKSGSGVISSSHAAGYDIAELVVSTPHKKQIALYYARGSAWHYVTQASDEFGFQCGPMSANPEVRNVFYDQVCLSAHGAVRLDTNNRAVQ
jgi:hypothetical protein